MDGLPATNLSELAADSVSLWSSATKSWHDVYDVFVEKTQITSPISVHIPVGDEVDTLLHYQNPTSKQVPALDGILAYIAQQKLSGGTGTGVTNRYVTINRKNMMIYEGDSYITSKQVVVHTVKRSQFIDVFAPVFIVKKIKTLKVVRPVYIFENAANI